MENIDLQDKIGKKFKPGEVVYIDRDCYHHNNRIGIVCGLFGLLSEPRIGLKEVYQVLVGKEIKYLNEFYLKPLDQPTIQNYKRKRAN